MTTLSAVLDWHLARYPLLHAPDIYKLVYQGVFGPGHLLRPGPVSRCQGSGTEHDSALAVRRALEEEFARLSSLTADHQPLSPVSETEPLDPEGRLVRVNLLPLRGEEEAVSRLAGVLMETCRTVSGDPAVMGRRLSEAAAWCRKNVPGQSVWLEEMAAAAPREGFPAIHHSAEYVAAYRPAYRVVRKDLWKQASA